MGIAPCMLNNIGAHYLHHYTLRRCTFPEDRRDRLVIAVSSVMYTSSVPESGWAGPS